MTNLDPMAGSEPVEDSLEGVTFDGEELPSLDASSKVEELTTSKEDEVVLVVAPKDRKPGDEGVLEEPQPYINQKAVTKVINEKHRKMREAEERADAADTKAAALEQKLNALNTPSRPVVPQLPDPLDPDIVAKTAVRDQAIKSAAEFDFRANSLTQSKVQEAQLSAAKATEEVQLLVSDYGKRVVALGYDPKESAEAEQVVVSYLGRTNPLNPWILGQEDGPLIVDFLSQNPQLTQKLASMAPTSAAVKIRSYLAAPTATTPQSPQEQLLNNPAPAKRTIRNSRTSTVKENEFLKGVTFS